MVFENSTFSAKSVNNYRILVPICIMVNVIVATFDTSTRNGCRLNNFEGKYWFVKPFKHVHHEL